jgi:hypothetical protein
MPTSTVPRPVPAGQATVSPVHELALDLVYGERDATRCSVCNRLMPALEHPKFELEDADTGLPLCDVDASRQNKPVRLAMALLNAIVEAYAAGDKKRADEGVHAIESGFSLLAEAAPKVPYQRAVRHQPVRRKPRSSRRK